MSEHVLMTPDNSAIELAPEEQRLLHLPDRFYNGLEFFEMVRELRKKRDTWIAGLYEITACDKWAYHTAQMFYKHGYWTGGKIGTPPADVVEILNELFGERNTDVD